MQTCIVRQPILNLNREVCGYEILYKEDVGSLYSEADSEAASTIEDFLQQLDGDRFLDGKKAYLTFTPNLLMKNIPKIFSTEKLVIQIEDNSLVHPLAQKIIYRYKSQGYQIAIKGFEFNTRYFSILDVVDIIKIDLSDPHNMSLRNIVDIGSSFQKTVIAYNVNSTEAFDCAVSLGCKYFQGTFVADTESTTMHRMDHMQSNFFQLVVAISKDEPDIDEITDIVSRDVTLAFALIKLVNSAYFALRNPAKSVKQALIVLGLGQLKQWVYLLSFKKDSGKLPDELVKTSFLRGTFCSELFKHCSNMDISKSEAYLLGMFSTLGVLMQVKLDDALRELSISDQIKKALLTGEGRCGLLYNLVLCYEKADWRGVANYSAQLGLPLNIVSQEYLSCVEHVNSIWNELMMPYDEFVEKSKA